ncbi:ParB/RepB/Spo0J family partition protein [Janthinobacterium sp. OK676]|uniref:ParB/RepB/Spo0J family partition protein n=1 Tax=Janthinobacterium sp. OK676 TaxID=1855295 RepID=UPI000890ADE6|nr:ParB/RepB/Spo0J family partition protein [Janthinobacterium sp. OK676]SDM78552.1 ParB/RepB/Spo0J family partition protein [Janthinobacterium sp. OK676]
MSSDLVIPTIGGMKKAPARSEKRIVVDELVNDQVFAITDWADIRPSYTNRKRFNQTALEQLAANIKEVGIVQPILIRPVTPTDDAPQHFEIVAGERRWRAGNIAELQRGPTMIRNLTDLQAREIQLLENLQREDPHPMEEAEGFQELMLNAGYTADRLVDKLKKSRSHIYGRLKLCALTTEVREKFLDNVISASTALLIARVPVPALQIKALADISAPYQGTGEPMPYRAALRHIQERYTVDLTRALFKLSDATLLPLAGACTKCPKKTGNQPEVFGDIKSADVCTDPDCYAEKRMAHDTLTIAAASKTGVPVYEGVEGETIYRKNTYDRYSLFVMANSPLWVFDRNSPATQNQGNAATYLDGGLLPEPAWYVKHEGGEVTPFYDKAPIQKLLEDAGACETVEVHAARMANVRAIAEKKEAAANTPAKQAEIAKARAEEAAAEKQAEQDELYRIELYRRLRAKGANGFSLASLREFTKLALTTHELPDQELDYPFDTSTTESIHAYIDQAGLPDVQLLLVDMLLGDCLAGDRYFSDDEYSTQEATMHAMARHEGIDPDAVRLQLEMDEIPFEDVQVQQLGDFIANSPGRLNDLTKFILAECPLMIKALEQAANTHGWYYAPGQVWLRADETSTPGAAHVVPEQSDDEDADDLADQINLAPQDEVAAIERPAATAVNQPEPETKKPAPRLRKPKSPTKPAAWPWPTSATALPTTAKETQ